MINNQLYRKLISFIIILRQKKHKMLLSNIDKHSEKNVPLREKIGNNENSKISQRSN